MSNHKGLQYLDSAHDVAEALGGTVAVAGIVGKIPQHVSRWKAANRFPAAHYLQMIERLRAAGFDAPSMLWGILPQDPIPRALETAAESASMPPR